MSHFNYVVSSVDRGWFGWGKSTGESWQVFDLALIAAQLKDWDALVGVFDREHWRWCIEDAESLVGLKRFFDWVQPGAVYNCLNDSGDMPWSLDPVCRWWPCVGSLGRAQTADVFGIVGHISGDRPAKAPTFWSWLEGERDVEELRKWLKSCGHTAPVIEGFPLV